jgi:hypothetical protein
MTKPIEALLPMDDQDLVNLRVHVEVFNRRGIAHGDGTRLSAFLALSEPHLGIPATSQLIGIDEGQMYELLTSGKPVPPETEEIIGKLYAIGAMVWEECAEFKGNFERRVLAAREKLTTPTFHLKKDPRDPSSPDRSIIQAIKDGDLERVLSMADYQLGDPKD